MLLVTPNTSFTSDQDNRWHSNDEHHNLSHWNNRSPCFMELVQLYSHMHQNQHLKLFQCCGGKTLLSVCQCDVCYCEGEVRRGWKRGSIYRWCCGVKTHRQRSSSTKSTLISTECVVIAVCSISTWQTKALLLLILYIFYVCNTMWFISCFRGNMGILSCLTSGIIDQWKEVE